MKKILDLMKDLKKKGFIKEYALFGAMAVAVYDEAISTQDFDMVAMIEKDGFIDMSPIYQYAIGLGYKMVGHHIIIDGIPLDIMVVKNDPDDLLYEALHNAISEKTDVGMIRVFSPDYLVAVALQAGRKKDYRKIDLLLNSGRITEKLMKILKKHKLTNKWIEYRKGNL